MCNLFCLLLGCGNAVVSALHSICCQLNFNVDLFRRLAARQPNSHLN